MAKLFGYENPNFHPMAELWIGAHHRAPSSIEINGKEVRLDKWIDDNPSSILGKHTAQVYGNKLPYLFKILSAKTPLSIQSHPSKQQAELGWKRENLLGISSTAPNRSYKDNNHKPELVYALTPFHALNGFRTLEDILEICVPLNCDPLNVLLEHLTKEPNEIGLKSFYSALMQIETPQLLVQAVVESCQKALRNTQLQKEIADTYNLTLELHHHYPLDIGVVSALILNYIVLEPGESMFLHAGTLHSYLKGTAIEVMASSDNVLRGGLTPKHIDVEELLNTTRYVPLSPDKIKLSPTRESNSDLITFQTPVQDFNLSLAKLEKTSSCSFNSTGPTIFFVIEGKVVLFTDREERLEIFTGESCFLSAETNYITLKGEGKVAITSCN